jgi:hypothetical protein
MKPTLPIDRNKAFRESDYPSDPEAYRPLRHFAQRFKESRRHLDDEIIERCIREGDLRDNGDGCACFRLEWGDGVAYYLIVAHHEDGYLVVVTAWPHLHNREAALRSGMWAPGDLDEIDELNKEQASGFRSQFPDYDSWLNSQSA